MSPFAIHDPYGYSLAMSEIDALSRKGFDNLTESEERRLDELTDAVEKYEAIHYPMPLKAVDDMTKGGIVNGPAMALVGNLEHDRPEYILPKEVLDRLTCWVPAASKSAGRKSLEHLQRNLADEIHKARQVKWVYLAVGLASGAIMGALITLALILMV